MIEYQYCPKCGKSLENKTIGELSAVPFCWNCHQPYLKTFRTSIIVSVINEHQEVMLLKRPYLSTGSPELIAGKIQYGDSAEMTVAREVAEETGHALEKVKFVESYFYEKQEMLMLGFIASVHSQEVLKATHDEESHWCHIDAALDLVAEGSIAEKHLVATKHFVDRHLQEPFDRMFETG